MPLEPVSTATAISVSARILSPLISDIYQSVKGTAQQGLSRWQATTFPKRLAKRISALSEVKTLWSPDDDVSILDFYLPPTLHLRDVRQIKPIGSISEMGDGNIVVQGIVGQGKSIFLRYLAVKEATIPAVARLPIFIELRNLQAKLTLTQMIYKTLSSYDIEIDEPTFDHLAKSGRLILLLDAFDELDESLTLSTLTEISHLTQKYPELQLIVTSRPGNEIQKVVGFRTMRILPLRRNQYPEFLRKLGLSTTKIVEITDAIDASPSELADLITTPLMLTLVVIVYESEKEIPPTLPEFFERLFQVVFTRHDRLKAGFNRKRYSGLSDRRLQTLFEAFCFMVLQNSFGRSLSAEQFSKAFKQAVEYMDDCKCDEDDFRKDLVKAACLMLEEGIDTTTFLHKSVLEYYAAAFIKHSTDEVAKLFYQAVYDNQRSWREVIRFLADIDPYRYSKEFALNELDKIRREFISPQIGDDISDSDLLNSLTTFYPSISVDYQKTDDDQYTYMGVDILENPPGIMYEPFETLLIDALESMLPNSVSKNELENIMRYEIEGDHELVSASIYDAVQYDDTKKIREALKIFANQIDRMINETHNIIARQEKRKLLFESSQMK